MTKRYVGLGLLLLIFSPHIYGSVGSITNQIKTVPQIVRDKNTLPGVKGTGVEMNDTIKTTLGIADITFVDDTKVQVNENSKLVIDDFVYDPKGKTPNKLGLKFAAGTVRYASGAIAHNNPNSVNINTPAATVAVRGTDFSAVVDEFGESSIILLPSCPANYINVETDCKTGVIDVYNDAGSVTLDKPFMGTKVVSRQLAPSKPVVLNLNPNQINNLLIVSPPKEFKQQEVSKDTNVIRQNGDMLDIDYLKQDFLKNELANYNPLGDDPLAISLLQQNFLDDIFHILSEQLRMDAAALLSNMLNPENQLLPDWFPSSNVTKLVTPINVTLSRDDGSDVQSVTTTTQDRVTITMIENGVTIKNRVNDGKSSTIILRQN